MLKYAEFFRTMILDMGGTPTTAYAVAAEWCRGLLPEQPTGPRLNRDYLPHPTKVGPRRGRPRLRP